MAAARGNILDLRAAGLHAEGHLRGSATVPLEPELVGLSPRWREARLSDGLPSIFLPPRHEPLLVVAEREEIASLAAAHLANRGRRAVAFLALDRRVLARVPRDLRGCGRSRRTLWRPPEFLSRWAHLLPPPAAGGVLDLACGSGRAAVWLARRGWRVTGLDHQAGALSLAARLASSSGVALDLRTADLRAGNVLPGGRWAAILLLRFLDRELVARLPASLRRGGVVFLSTFRDAPGLLGNPRPAHRLRRDEATAFWPPGLMEILVHQEGFDGDGRPTAGVVGRRPASG